LLYSTVLHCTLLHYCEVLNCLASLWLTISLHSIVLLLHCSVALNCVELLYRLGLQFACCIVCTIQLLCCICDDVFRATMKQLGLILTEEDVHAMMRSVGVGPLGKISYSGEEDEKG